MDIRLIAFDLDGTLLDDDKNISGENLRAMERAAEKGIMLVPATGRIYRGLPELLRSLPFLRRYILVNGAYVYDAGEDRCLVREDIDCARALEFLAYADTLGVLYDCYQDNWGYMTERMLEEALRVVPSAAARDLIRTLRSPVPELKRYLRQQGTGVQKLQLYFTDPEQRLRELEKLPDLFPDLSISTSVFCNIEINARGATKGRALLSLCGELGLDPSQTMALGDETNDLEMLQKAGLGVAMGNAEPAVRDAADAVTGSNNESGFAAAVEKYAL